MSSAPLHQRVRRDIEQQIADGIWQPGSYLPSEYDLMERYRVSRTTIRKTISDLVMAGKVIIERGVGTRVAIPIPDPQIGLSISEMLRLQGRTPGVAFHSAEVQRSSPRVTADLGLAEPTRVLAIRRVYTADGAPVSCSQSFLPADTLAGTPIEKLNADISLYDLLARLGHAITTVVDAYTLVRVDQQSAADLELEPGDPALAIERQGLDANGICLESSRIIFRSDRYQPLNVIRRSPK